MRLFRVVPFVAFAAVAAWGQAAAPAGEHDELYRALGESVLGHARPSGVRPQAVRASVTTPAKDVERVEVTLRYSGAVLATKYTAVAVVLLDTSTTPWRVRDVGYRDSNQRIPFTLNKPVLARILERHLREHTHPFTVTAAQVTFDVEGEEGGPYHSRRPHQPSAGSGVTIGRGYDLRKGLDPAQKGYAKQVDKLRAQVVRDLTSAGVSPALRALFGDVAGQPGAEGMAYLNAWKKVGQTTLTRAQINALDAEARALIVKNVSTVQATALVAKRLEDASGKGDRTAAQAYLAEALQGMEITPAQQKKLFPISWQGMADDVRRISDRADAVAAYGAVRWDRLDPMVHEMLVDLRFRGDYRPESRKLIQKHAADSSRGVPGSRRAFVQAMANWKAWRPLMGDRLKSRFDRRVDFLRAAVVGREVLAVAHPTARGFRVLHVQDAPAAGGRRCVVQLEYFGANVGTRYVAEISFLTGADRQKLLEDPTYRDSNRIPVTNRFDAARERFDQALQVLPAP